MLNREQFFEYKQYCNNEIIYKHFLNLFILNLKPVFKKPLKSDRLNTIGLI
jgi:hypothetical protein